MDACDKFWKEINHSARIAVVAALIVGAFASLATAEVNTNNAYALRLYGFAEQFEWKESVNGQELLKESGPLLGVGGELGLKLADTFWLEGRGEVFLGGVDYDGAIMTYQGDLIPYKSTTKYVGLKIEGDMALKVSIGTDMYMKPYCGLGLRTWRRTLDTKLSDKYIGEWGYVEEWLTIYGIIGFGGGIAVGKDGKFFGRIEGRLPLSNSMTADLKNQGGPSDVEMKPGRRPSLYAECGFNMSQVTASIFVETLEFSESPLDDKYQIAFQPDSKATMIGVKFGLAF